MIVVNLDVMMAKRKIGLGELAEKIDLTPANLSILKNNKAKSSALHHAERHLQGAGLPARRPAGVGGYPGGERMRCRMEFRRTVPKLGALCAFLLFAGAALSAQSLKGK